MASLRRAAPRRERPDSTACADDARTDTTAWPAFGDVAQLSRRLGTHGLRRGSSDLRHRDLQLGHRACAKPCCSPAPPLGRQRATSTRVMVLRRCVRRCCPCPCHLLCPVRHISSTKYALCLWMARRPLLQFMAVEFDVENTHTVMAEEMKNVDNCDNDETEVAVNT